MKIKYNIPMINEIKNNLNKIKEKIKLNKNDKKVPMKYYTLLLLMLALGTISLSNNIKRYNKSNKEDFKEYGLKEENINKSSTVSASNEKVYLTAESSIYIADEFVTDAEDVIETISSNSKNLTLPVQGEIIKEYAMEKLVYSKTLGMWKTHPGIDIKTEIGTDVLSVSDGVVKDILNDDFYGNTVIIEDDIYLYKYSNLDKDIILNKGENVKQGDIIGKVGLSAKGELQDDSHLHFEILKNNIQINPLDLIGFVE